MKTGMSILKKLNEWKVFVVVIIIFFAGFYWYSLRPSLIKKGCFVKAQESAIREYQKDHYTKDKLFNPDDYNLYYRWCLQKKGL